MWEMLRSARGNAQGPRTVSHLATGRNVSRLVCKDWSSPMFRYVTINGRSDNCLLSSLGTPGQNVGYHNSSQISARNRKNVLLRPELITNYRFRVPLLDYYRWIGWNMEHSEVLLPTFKLGGIRDYNFVKCCISILWITIYLGVGCWLQLGCVRRLEKMWLIRIKHHQHCGWVENAQIAFIHYMDLPTTKTR